MADPQTRNAERSRRAIAPILLAASLVCLLVSTRSLEGLPERVGVTVAGFFQRGFSAVGLFVSDTVASIAELRRLRSDYLELASKLERYTNMERGMAELREENARLKAAQPAGFAAGKKFTVSIHDGPKAVVRPEPGEHPFEAYKRVTGVLNSVHAPVVVEAPDDAPLGIVRA